ncbi:hypothetical protein LguiB_026561 [Lonicera macranthoides]
MFGTRNSLRCLVLALTLHVAVVAGEYFKPFNVTYDHRALIIDGHRRMLIAAGIHYPRATPQMWPDLIAKSKEGGADVIQTYAFWNGHEPVRGQYNFEGQYDIVKFAKLVGSSGLYLHLRIGPYVCAEWNFGGFPVWLRDIPGIEFRTDNAPFKKEMQRFVKKIVDLMRDEMLLSWQGGPIIMFQIENEYGNIESSYGQKGKDYVKWAAEMAVGLGAGVPWVMCKQVDAPEYIIDACNGYYCDGFRPNSNKKPVLWTENWDGWYTSWGARLPHRPVEDIAFAVARFFQRGGSFQNYYMYFGGTNFGRTSGGPNYITSYDYDAPLDEYGLLSQPKWGHLKDLHAAIKLCEASLVAVDSPQYVKLGPMQEAHLYRGNVQSRGPTSKLSGNESRCSAFLANIDENKAATVKFLGQVYTLPPWSVSILPDCKNTAYNTAKIASLMDILELAFGSGYNHEFCNDDPNPKSCTNYCLHFKSGVSLSAKGHWTKVVQTVQLVQGFNDVVLVSQTVGLQNYGAFMEKDGAGIKGKIKLTGSKNGDVDLTESSWTYQIGLNGESLKLYSIENNENEGWTDLTPDAIPSIFSWYKTYFDSPEGSDPVVVDLGSMGKGQAWVNGHHIGRYWNLVAPKDGCQETCDYRGAYDSDKCTTNCGEPTQIRYHIPRSWLQRTKNLLVLFEETGGNPFEITVKSVATRTICSQVSETHYPPLRTWAHPDFISGKITMDVLKPEMQLQCEDGHIISSIEFASYGTPQGSCQKYSKGNCHAPDSLSVVSQACEGKNGCSVEISNSAFGADPCRGTVKTLAVEAKCSSSSSSSSSLNVGSSAI